MALLVAVRAEYHWLTVRLGTTVLDCRVVMNLSLIVRRFHPLRVGNVFQGLPAVSASHRAAMIGGIFCLGSVPLLFGVILDSLA